MQLGNTASPRPTQGKGLSEGCTVVTGSPQDTAVSVYLMLPPWVGVLRQHSCGGFCTPWFPSGAGHLKTMVPFPHSLPSFSDPGTWQRRHWSYGGLLLPSHLGWFLSIHPQNNLSGAVGILLASEGHAPPYHRRPYL
jgi:hypothetical protein